MVSPLFLPYLHVPWQRVLSVRIWWVEDGWRTLTVTSRNVGSESGIVGDQTQKNVDNFHPNRTFKWRENVFTSCPKLNLLNVLSWLEHRRRSWWLERHPEGKGRGENEIHLPERVGVQVSSGTLAVQKIEKQLVKKTVTSYTSIKVLFFSLFLHI